MGGSSVQLAPHSQQRAHLPGTKRRTQTHKDGSVMCVIGDTWSIPNPSMLFAKQNCKIFFSKMNECGFLQISFLCHILKT